MCERLVNTIHRLTFRQKQTEPPKAGGGAVDASETDEEEEAISTHGRLIKIQGPDHQSKAQPVVAPHGQIEKPRRSNSINKKVDDFIARTKMKIRSASGVGSHPPP